MMKQRFGVYENRKGVIAECESFALAIHISDYVNSEGRDTRAFEYKVVEIHSDSIKNTDSLFHGFLSVLQEQIQTSAPFDVHGNDLTKGW